MEGQRTRAADDQRSPFKWRKNTLVEQRRIRNDRKKRKRHQRRKESSELKWQADAATKGLSERLLKESQQKERMRFLARKYYLKWRQNQEALKTIQERAENSAKQPSAFRFGTRAKMFSLTDTRVDSNVSEIRWNHLMSPKDKDGNDETIQLGHGIFGECQKRYYKGIPVAVKVFNNLSSSRDVSHEAAVMAECSHPSIPHIFGANVTQKPYFHVSYFYGIGSSTCTLYRVLHSRSMSLSKSSAGKVMLQLCQALEHLHLKRLLHRDIKGDNILITMVNNEYHPMLIDFGKAIWLSDAPSKRKSMTALEKDEYRRKYRHIAPEIVNGQPPSFASDIFSFGLVMLDVSDKVETGDHFLEVQRKCLIEDPKLRCSISYLLSQLAIERNVSGLNNQ